MKLKFRWDRLIVVIIVCIGVGIGIGLIPFCLGWVEFKFGWDWGIGAGIYGQGLLTLIAAIVIFCILLVMFIEALLPMARSIFRWFFEEE